MDIAVKVMTNDLRRTTMSDLIYKAISVLILTISLSACGGEGAFKAADLSVKDNTDLGPQQSGTPAPVLTPEQIKELANYNERRIQELEEEIALKNEAFSNIQVRQAQTEEEQASLNQKILEVLASNKDSADKVEELTSLKQQVEALNAQILSDREQYEEVLTSVNENDQALTDSLTEVINEINRLKREQGGLADEELIALEERLTAKINEKISEEEGSRSTLAQEIRSLEQEIQEITEDIGVIEGVMENPQGVPNQQEILKSLNELKERLIALEQKRDAKKLEQRNIEEIIAELSCAVQEETCAVLKESVGAPAAVVTENENENTPDVENSEEQSADAGLVSEEGQQEALPEATLEEKIEVLESQILSAQESISALEEEVAFHKEQRKVLQDAISDIDNKMFDQQIAKESASDDAQVVAAETALSELSLEKNQKLTELRTINKNIETIEENELKMLREFLQTKEAELAALNI